MFNFADESDDKWECIKFYSQNTSFFYKLIKIGETFKLAKDYSHLSNTNLFISLTQVFSHNCESPLNFRHTR